MTHLIEESVVLLYRSDIFLSNEQPTLRQTKVKQTTILKLFSNTVLIANHTEMYMHQAS